MCGFFGIHFHQKISRSQLQSLEEHVQSILSVRGPDAWKSHKTESSLICSARLEIRGSREGDQPVFMPDSSLLVYNGEIYNFKSINENYNDLISDTKHLANFLNQKGELEQLDGMFAFAQHGNEHITLARDRFGIKPLFYVKNDKFFAYSSDPRCFFTLIDKRIDSESLAHYLAFNYIPGEKHLFEGIKKLKPGHIFEYQIKSGEIRSLQFADVYSNSFPNLDTIIEQSVSEQEKLGKTERGIYFSGGMDSTLLAAMSSKEETILFHVKFNEMNFSEFEKASEFAKYDKREIYGTEFNAHAFLHHLPELCASLPSPLADPGHYPLWWLNRWISRNHKAKYFLSGDGADELFCGYQTMGATLLHQKLSHLPHFVRHLSSTINLPLNALNETKIGLDYKVNKFTSGLELDNDQAHFYWRNVFHPSEINLIMETDYSFKDLTRPFKEALSKGREIFPNDTINSFLYADLKTWLVDNNLFKVDHASSSFGLEARVPYLSNRLAAASFAISGKDKFKFFKNKPHLRNYLKKKVPKKFLRNKSPFHPPYREWFQGELHQFAKNSLREGILSSKIFNTRYFQRLVDQIFDNERTNSFKIYNLLILEYWLRENL